MISWLFHVSATTIHLFNQSIVKQKRNAILDKGNVWEAQWAVTTTRVGMINNQFKMRVMKYLHSHLPITDLVHYRNIKCQTMVWLPGRGCRTRLHPPLNPNDAPGAALGGLYCWLPCSWLLLWEDGLPTRHTPTHSALITNHSHILILSNRRGQS